MNDDEATFSVEVPTEHQKFLWSDKYRPRKPRFFNRVHTGFEWNKYNQTHYDIDNPPPKIVQGYKFNVSRMFVLKDVPCIYKSMHTYSGTSSIYQQLAWDYLQDDELLKKESCVYTQIKKLNLWIFLFFFNKYMYKMFIYCHVINQTKVCLDCIQCITFDHCIWSSLWY